MKIVHVCLCSQFADNLTYQENLLVKYHLGFGHQVDVITTCVKLDSSGREIAIPSGTQESELGYRIFRLENRFFSKLRIFKGLRKTLEEIKPDFIFIHGTQFVSLLTIIRYVKKNNIKIVGDNHADYYNSAQTFISKLIFHKILWRFTTQLLVKSSNKIFGVSPIRCKFLEEMYNVPKEKVELLPLGADDILIDSIKKNFVSNEIQVKYTIPDGFNIVTGGKIDPNKNLKYLASSVRKLKLEGININLIVFGIINQEVIDDLKDHDLYSFINPIGWLGPTEMYELFIFSNLNVFIGSHSVLWEQAVACGKPAIFQRIEGMDHVNVNGNCTLIEDSKNIKELSNIIRKFIFDKNYYEEVCQRALKAAEEFSYSKISQKALDV